MCFVEELDIEFGRRDFKVFSLVIEIKEVIG